MNDKELCESMLTCTVSKGRAGRDGTGRAVTGSVKLNNKNKKKETVPAVLVRTKWIKIKKIEKKIHKSQEKSKKK